ncbi:histidine phosphatase family protein [Humitalea sp. 24SJ18S-53]|uniref:histidine phosphatase family protein n=1 Tax=Humitalea sp. 24SJ18S-53 TaxID=3422307 RepID=UPI003D66D871
MGQAQAMRRRALIAAPAFFVAPKFFVDQAAATTLVGALQAGGVVVVMRHGITDRSQADTGDLRNRAAQRNLSDAGRAQAQRVGAAVAALRIPIGQVLASPVFRARDTAEIAFGARAVVEPMLNADDYTPDPMRLDQQIAWLRARSGRPSGPAVTDILVGHIVPLGMVLGRGLTQAEYPEGAMAIFAPGPDTGRLLGILPADALFVAAG